MRTDISRNERLAFSVGEAASLLGVSRQHIYSLIARGLVRSVMLGGRRVIPRSVLLELLGEPAEERS